MNINREKHLLGIRRKKKEDIIKQARQKRELAATTHQRIGELIKNKENERDLKKPLTIIDKELLKKIRAMSKQELLMLSSVGKEVKMDIETRQAICEDMGVTEELLKSKFLDRVTPTVTGRGPQQGNQGEERT
jgi:coenzyme F420-reducing hydrogenase alpha subunit